MTDCIRNVRHNEEHTVAGDELEFGRRLFLAALIAAAGACLGTSAALADRGRRGRDDEDDDDDDDDDYGPEEARRARAAGEITSLTKILAVVQEVHPGEVVGVELERDAGRWIYEIKIITPQNRYLEIDADARDGAILKVEGD